MTSACHRIAEPSVHHPRLDGKVDHSLFIPVIYTGEFRLVRLLLHDFHLFDNLRRDILGSQLRVVKEELLAVDHHLSNCLPVGSDSTVRIDLHSGKFLQQFLQHVIVRCLEKGCSVLYSVFLDNHLIADSCNPCCLQKLDIRFESDSTEVHGFPGDLDDIAVGLVSHHFGFEKEHSVPHTENVDLSVCGTHRKFICPCSGGIGKGNSGKPHRLPVGRIRKNHADRNSSLSICRKCHRGHADKSCNQPQKDSRCFIYHNSDPVSGCVHKNNCLSAVKTRRIRQNSCKKV